MKAVGFFFLLLLHLQVSAAFSDYFLDKTLRIDYTHSGNYKEEIYSLEQIKQEPFWGGTKTNLIDMFDYGKYMFIVMDSASGRPVYSHSYSTLFCEWQTTEEAKTKWSSFSETIVFPFPKKTAQVKFFSRNDKGMFVMKFEITVNPADYSVLPEKKQTYKTVDIQLSGETSDKVDIVFIPDGYTEKEMALFIKDCKRFKEQLFKYSPFKENKDKFNIRSIEAPSEESGTDIPAENILKNTLLSTSFYTFGSERYLMTTDNKTLHDIASAVPYDQICIIVNTDKYGGGGIYNFYSVCVNNHKEAELVFVHEFGHAFAGLADEYYTSEVSYQDFYPLDVEPWNSNITTRVDFERKWKNMLAAGTPIPTPPTEEYKDSLGVFEGGGYVEKGVYRPAVDCTMKTMAFDKFCAVCKAAIQKMIDFYAE